MPYSKPPIAEAVFDINIVDLTDGSVQRLPEFHERVKAEYPDLRPKKQIKGIIHFGENNSPDTNTEVETIGYISGRHDQSRQIQVRRDGFTYNILKGYEEWDKHFPEFLRFWQMYVELFQPEGIRRIATRYINRIPLPIPFGAFQDYVVNIPPIPPVLPQSFSQFFMQTQVPCADNLRHAIITETLEPENNGVLPFVLDIDVYQTQGLSNSTESLGENFLAIRNIKNEIFESCITQKTRGLFA